MKLITLKNEQIKQLLNEKRLILDYKNSTSLEIYDNIITLNDNGNLYKLKSLSFEFEKRNIENIEIIRDFQETICKYLNLSPNEVIFYCKNKNEMLFKIRLLPEKELTLIVCDRNTAIANTNELFETTAIKNDKQIGIYRQLENSFYYFRWESEE